MRQIQLVLLLAAALMGSAGCQRAVNIPQGRLSPTTMEVDEAMQIRDWDRSVAYYQNPRFIAGNTGFWYEVPYYPNQWWYAVWDPTLMPLQTAGLAYTLFAIPLWKPVVYAGETLEPTYHAMPPLPPTSASQAKAQEYESLPPAPPEPAEVPEPMPEAPAIPPATEPQVDSPTIVPALPATEPQSESPTLVPAPQ